MNPFVQDISNAQRAAAARALPGMQPVGAKDWLTIDPAYSAQLAEKSRILQQHRDQTLIVLPEARKAALETLEEILILLAARPDFQIGQKSAKRPDGTEVMLDRDAPLETLGQLIQEDVCILQQSEGMHRLTAALLCFPASWTLSEKIGRPLGAIHGPVEEYTDHVARRVQRLFDGVRPGQPIWRANLLRYSTPKLYHPKREGEKRKTDAGSAIYERSERQTLWRLPKSEAVIFAIHTSIRPA